jgi:hypothetical protein
MFCTCYTINNSTVPITHIELMTRQTYKTPERLFVQKCISRWYATIHRYDGIRETLLDVVYINKHR